MEIKINAPIKIEILTRIKVLFGTIRELASAFGAEAHVLESLRKGIIIREIISELELNYLNENDEAVCKIVFNIDWNKHQLFVQQDLNSFEVDSNKSLSEQLASWTTDIIEVTKDIRQQFDIKSIRAIFRYKPEIINDDVKYQEAREFLGHIPRSNFQWAKNESPDYEWEFTIGELSELNIKIEHKG